jgi:hypothetical protein
MEPEGSLLHSQAAATCPYPQPARSSPYPPHRTSLRYLANSLAAALSEPALYRLLTFHVANLLSIFRCLGRTKVSVQVRGKCSWFATKSVFTARNCQHSLNPQAEGPPLVGCPRLLIQYIRSYPPYWRPFPHPQPEDAPCRGDRHPFTSALNTFSWSQLYLVVRLIGCFLL